MSLINRIKLFLVKSLIFTSIQLALDLLLRDLSWNCFKALVKRKKHTCIF